MRNAPGQAATSRVNFTNTFIAEVPLPESGRQIYWDTKERNLGLRVTPLGRTLFVRVRVSTTLKSKVYEHNLDEQRDIKLARNEAAERRIELRSGIDRALNKKRAAEQKMREEEESKLQKMRPAVALEDYIAARAKSTKPLSARTIADYRGLIAGELSRVKDVPLEEFTREYCERLIKDIAADIVARSRNSIKAAVTTPERSAPASAPTTPYDLCVCCAAHTGSGIRPGASSKVSTSRGWKSGPSAQDSTRSLVTGRQYGRRCRPDAVTPALIFSRPCC